MSDTPQPPPAPLRRLLLRFGLLLLTLIALFALLETAARIHAWRKYGSSEAYRTDLFRPHHYICYEAIPNHAGMLEGKGRMDTNSLGFRSPELTVEKRADTFRIAFFGGSTTFCSTVSGNENTYPMLVGQHLAEAYPDRRFEVMNCGLHGYSSWENLLTYLTKVVPYAPDLAVLYQGNNDMYLEADERYDNDYAGYRRSWVKSDDLLSRALRRSALINGIRSKYGLGTLNSLVTAQQDGDEDRRSARLQRHDAAVFRRNTHHFISVATHQGTRVLLATQAYAERPGRRFNSLGVTLHNRATREIAQERSVPLYDFEQALQGKDAWFMPNDHIHLTPEGVRHQARMFADWIIGAGIIR